VSVQLHARSTRVFLVLASLLVAACSSDDSDNADGGPSTSEDSGSPDSTTSNPDSGSGTKDAGHDSGTKTDSGTTPDAGTDSSPGTSDAGSDATTPDAGSDGATTPDSGNEDASNEDAGDGGGLPPLLGAWTFDDAPETADASADGGTSDAAIEDSGTSDSSIDAGGLSSADVSGNGHPAMFQGGATFGAGKSGGGLVLDGTSGYADVGVTLIDTSKSYTVMSWVELNQVGNWEIALSEDDVNGSLFGLKLRGNDNHFDFDMETSDQLNPGFVVAESDPDAGVGLGVASAWTHLVGVYDASGTGNVTLYVNGALIANAAVGQAILAATGHFLIGRGLYNDAVGSYLNGTIDEVAVYDGALTGAQVATIYAAQQ
jgi:hypothetical protein